MPEPVGVLGSAINCASDLAGAQPCADRLSVTLLTENGSSQSAGGAGSLERRFFEEQVADGIADAEGLSFFLSREGKRENISRVLMGQQIEICVLCPNHPL